MNNLNPKVIVFNLAGIAALLIVGVYAVNSFFAREEILSCTQRYQQGEQFSLQNNKGELLTPIELQARVPTREWGLLKNARVVAAKDKSAAYLQVSMANDAERDQEDPEEAERGGIGFTWQPKSLSSSRAGCLSYRVFMPKDFSFEGPGSLPGLFAADLAELDIQPKQGFVARLGWQKGGAIGIELRAPQTSGMWIGAQKLLWPVDRWVLVDQEVVINSPGKSDGVLRLWVDGELKINNAGLNLGGGDKSSLSGVVSDIRFNQKEVGKGRVTISQFLVMHQ